MTQKNSKSAGKGKGKKQVSVVVVKTTAPKARKQRSSSVTALKQAVKAMTLKGRGGYIADAGESLGNSAGGFLGRMGGNFVERLLGRGSYSVKSNSIMTMSEGIPSFSNNPGNDAVEIFHKEFVGDIIASGSTAWSVVNILSLNPGMPATYPFLASLAPNFEQYEIVGAVVVYEPTSGSISTTQGLGSIQVATQYDAADPQFGSQAEMLEYEYASSCSPNKGLVHPIECAPRNNVLARLYTRSGPQANLQLFDLGKTTVAIAGVPASAGVVLGKLWITYHMRLYKPKVYGSIVGNTVGCCHWAFVPTAGSYLNIFGTDTNLPVFSSGNLSALATVAGKQGPTYTAQTHAGSVNFGPAQPQGGVVRVMLAIAGSNTSVTSVWTVSGFANCQLSAVNRYNGYNTFYNNSAIQGTAIVVFDLDMGVQFNPAAGGCAFTIAVGASTEYPASPTYLDLMILQLPQACI